MEKDEKEKKDEQQEVTKEKPTANTDKAPKESEKKEKSSEKKEPKKSEVKKEVKESNEKKESKDSKDAKDTKAPKEEKNDKKKGKGFKITIIILAIALVIGIVTGLVYTLGFAPTTIDLSKYIKVEYDGYDGYATATIELDEDAIKDKIKDSSTARQFIKKLELEIDKNEKISNGDELKIKADIKSSFLKDNRLKLKDKTVKIKVSGLEETNTIDMAKYIEIKYKGANKHATAEASLKENIKDEIGEKVYKELSNQISFSIKDNKDLANEATIKVSISVPESWLQENGIKFKSETVDFKVEGLVDATEIDVFKDININITGMSPNLQVSVTTNSQDEFIKTVRFSASKTSGIANGDTITITATSWDEEMADGKNYAVQKDTMEYKVEGQAAYIFKTSEINDNIKSQIKSTFIEKARSNCASTEWGWYTSPKDTVRNYTDYQYVDIEYPNTIEQDLSVGEPELVSLYLMTKKEDAYASDTNRVVGIIRVPFTSAKSGVTYNWYVTIIAANFSIKADGSISDNATYSVNYTYGSSEDIAYSNYINSDKSSFNVDRINL